jgi:hypothetical protein
MGRRRERHGLRLLLDRRQAVGHAVRASGRLRQVEGDGGERRGGGESGHGGGVGEGLMVVEDRGVAKEGGAVAAGCRAGEEHCGGCGCSVSHGCRRRRQLVVVVALVGRDQDGLVLGASLNLQARGTDVTSIGNSELQSIQFDAWFCISFKLS